jgi:Skp family chaperone for outer membrane proteins
MTSVLNVGVMPSNPVGNQIRSLQSQLETVKKNHQMLLNAIEAKSPEIYAEYLRSREEVSEREANAQRVQQQQQQQTQFRPSVPQRTAGSRF